MAYRHLLSDSPRRSPGPLLTPRSFRRASSTWLYFAAGLLVALSTFFLIGACWLCFQVLQPVTRSPSHSASADVLVMYVFSNTDPQYLDNLRYFVREGVAQDDGCDYVFIVNQGNDEVRRHPTPVCPSTTTT